jgi:hypothetical protein
MREKSHMKSIILIAAVVVSAFCLSPSAFGFEGRINVVMTRGGQTSALLYTAGTNFLRVENTAMNWPNPVDILDRNSGELTLLFPNNRSFFHLQPAAENSAAMPRGFPPMPGGLSPGVSPQPQPSGVPAMPNMPAPPGIGPTNLPGMPAPPQMPSMPQMPVANGMPAMPMMPPPMMEKMELVATGDKTNLLGFACEKFELKQHGEMMEIWATDELLPFQPYLQNQPHRFGPPMIEERWGELLKAKKLFPLLAVLRFEAPATPGNAAPSPGPERMRFEVKAVTPEKITDDGLFLPPPDYQEIQPLPF